MRGDRQATAIELTTGGIPVVPVLPDRKDPIRSLAPHGAMGATTDPRTIQEWLALWPDMNFGIRLGAESGLVAVDRDPRHGADLTASVYPSTWTTETGGGGLHLLYRLPRDRAARAGRLGPGDELRADNQYVLFPWSVHPNGRPYQPRDPWAEIALLPPALLAPRRPDHQTRQVAARLSRSLSPAVAAEVASVRRSLVAGPFAEQARRLLAGDWHGTWPSQSEADFNLLVLASYWSQDPAVLDGVLRTSGLVRAKWSREDYRLRTVAGALARRAELAGRALTGAADPCLPPHLPKMSPFADVYGVIVGTFTDRGIRADRLKTLQAVADWLAVDRPTSCAADGFARLPVEQMARELGVHRRTILRAVTDLAEAGIVETHVTHERVGGRPRATRWVRLRAERVNNDAPLSGRLGGRP